MNETSTDGNSANNLEFQGKIAIITDVPSHEDDFHSPDRLVKKYGAKKIVHVTWPRDFVAERGKISESVAALAADREIKALIISQAVPGTNDAIDKFKQIRDDVFIVFCTCQEPAAETTMRANLLFDCNQVGMGSAMARQAKKQGAKVFIHYTFPRHMSQPLLSARRDAIKQECLKEGIFFVDAIAPDPTGEAGFEGAQKFITEDVPKLVAKYGEDTAFFSTNCAHQKALIRAVVDCHAIFPQPCCPSPFHGFPEALGINAESGYADLNYVIGEACLIAEEKNMTDRLSTWPVSASMMFTNAGAEYAVKWINDEVPKIGIDRTVLEDCMNAYIEEVIGEASVAYISSCTVGGKTYENYKLVLMSYLDF